MKKIIFISISLILLNITIALLIIFIPKETNKTQPENKNEQTELINEKQAKETNKENNEENELFSVEEISNLIPNSSTTSF